MKRTILAMIVCLIIVLDGFSQVNIDSSLVAKYDFNGNANDLTGHGFDGIINGALPTSDRFGNPNSAYFFDGTSNITTTLTSVGSGDYDFTISLWFHTQNPSDGLFKPLISKHQNMAANSKCEFAMQIMFDGKIDFFMGDGIGYSSSYFPQVDVVGNQWNNALVTYSNGNLNFYVNASLVGNRSAINRYISPYNMIIGEYDNTNGGGSKQNFVGKIDDIRIYDRVLSSNEIDSLYDITTSNASYPDTEEVLLFPNPTNGRLNIILGTTNELVNYTVLTIDGKIVVEGKTSENTIKVDLLNNINGIYFLKINGENTNKTFKVIKQ